MPCESLLTTQGFLHGRETVTLADLDQSAHRVLQATKEEQLHPETVFCHPGLYPIKCFREAISQSSALSC